MLALRETQPVTIYWVSYWERVEMTSESFSIESVVRGYHLGGFGSFDFLHTTTLISVM